MNAFGKRELSTPRVLCGQIAHEEAGWNRDSIEPSLRCLKRIAWGGFFIGCKP